MMTVGWPPEQIVMPPDGALCGAAGGSVVVHLPGGAVPQHTANEVEGAAATRAR
jgi:hypothetical protein